MTVGQLLAQDAIELIAEDHPARQSHAAFVSLFPDLEERGRH